MSLTDESTKSEKSLVSVARLPLLPLHFEKRDFSEEPISFLKYSLEREFASIGRGMGIYHHVLCLGRNQGTYLEAVLARSLRSR